MHWNLLDNATKELRAVLFTILLVILAIHLPNFLHSHLAAQGGCPCQIMASEHSTAETQVDTSSLSIIGQPRSPDTKLCRSFDPNNSNLEQLLASGFSRYAADNLLKYRAKGGNIYRAEDLLRIYGVDSSLYVRLKPCVKLPSQRNGQLVDINNADSTAFDALPGIGPVLSARIIKFRTKLGGFVTTEILGMTYGLSPETFEKIGPMLKLDNPPSKRVIRDLSERELAAHPFISRQQARMIFNYVKAHGALPEQTFMEMPGFDDQERNNILLYFQFDE